MHNGIMYVIYASWSSHQKALRPTYVPTSSKYTITSGGSTSLIFSQLRMEVLNDADSGEYYCQVQLFHKN